MALLERAELDALVAKDPRELASAIARSERSHSRPAHVDTLLADLGILLARAGELGTRAVHGDDEVDELVAASERYYAGERHRELPEIGLARRQSLQRKSRSDHKCHPAPVAIARGKPDDLVGDPRYHRYAEDPRRDQPVPSRKAERREDKDRHDHHDQQKARSAARVQARETSCLARLEGRSGLIASDRLVLGAVILEDAS